MFSHAVVLSSNMYRICPVRFYSLRSIMDKSRAFTANNTIKPLIHELRAELDGLENSTLHRINNLRDQINLLERQLSLGKPRNKFARKKHDMLSQKQWELVLGNDS